MGHVLWINGQDVTQAPEGHILWITTRMAMMNPYQSFMRGPMGIQTAIVTMRCWNEGRMIFLRHYLGDPMIMIVTVMATIQTVMTRISLPSNHVSEMEGRDHGYVKRAATTAKMTVMACQGRCQDQLQRQ